MPTGTQNKPLQALIIEDSEFDATLLANLLRHGGYEVAWTRVETAASMRAALKARKWDIVLSDHQMPEFSAPEALRILQESGLDLPFVIVSGGIGEATAVAAMKAGAHDYLMKGQLGRLLPAVERELREAAVREARRQAERSLRESEMRYRLLWENAPDAVVLTDERGIIQFVNPAVTKLFGYASDEIVGKGIRTLQPDSDMAGAAPALHPEWQRQRQLDDRRMVETVAVRKDRGEFPVEVASSDMEMEGKTMFVAFIRDITERKLAERALRENEEQFRVAREIQQRLFPKSAPLLAGFDIAGASYPAEATGGDYYDYFPMLHDNLGIVVGDVTGHGIGPALLMAETRAYLRIVALNRDSVGEVLTRANRVIAEDVGSERFVTVLLAGLNHVERTLTYANAGHPPGYVLDSRGEITHRLQRTNVPLGLRHDTSYGDSRVIALSPGDLVLLLTDGFEEESSPEGAFFGSERVLETVRANRDRPASEIVVALYNAARAFAGGATQLDDLTAVVLKVLDR